MNSILLTGHAGYLGSRVAACLQRHGLAFDVLACRLHEITPASLQYRTVIHCAGKTSLSSTSDIEHVNVQGTERLIEGLAADARIIYASSRKVYPRIASQALAEDHPPAPWDAYGISKLAAERSIQRSGREFAIFRFGALFGHPTRCNKFPDLAAQAALCGTPIALAKPSRSDDYLDVEWMAELLVRTCSDGPHWGHVFNVSGPMRSLDGMLGALNCASLAVLGRTITINHTPFPVPVFPWLDTRKTQAFFPGFQQMDDQAIFQRMLQARIEARPGPG